MDSTDKNDGAPVLKEPLTQMLSQAEQDKKRRQKEAHKAYGRGHQIDVKGVRDRKLRRNLKSLETKYQTATGRAHDAEILLSHTGGFLEPERPLEKTYKTRQDDIQRDAAVETAQKRFDLGLGQLGPYLCEYSRNGRELLLGGRKGHVATFDWREGRLGCELQLGETVRDISWLHNNQFFAVAQKSRVFIYDSNGKELHDLRKHVEVSHMEFLPYHFLLATLGISGQLKYLDVSTGQLVSEIATKMGPPVSLTTNPYNAVLHAGHSNGTITLWSPNSSASLVKLLAHRGPVRSLAVEGHYMVSTGQDKKMAVWDVRNWKEVNSWNIRSPASSVAISSTGLTAVGWGTQTTIWKDLFSKHTPTQEKVQSPYMGWGGEGKRIERVRFCPFEDCLGVGHSEGFSQINIPGAGLANFDALEVNPFETTKQRQEAEVKGLLNKLRPEMIALDPNFIGNLDLRSEKQRQADKDLDGPSVDIATEIRNRARGKNSALKKYLRKQRKKNIIDDKRVKIDEIWLEQQKGNDKKHKETQQDLGPALGRFARKE